jgi:lysophospholipase L1-like esterase
VDIRETHLGSTSESPDETVQSQDFPSGIPPEHLCGISTTFMEKSHQLHIVSLGSSFAAGPGIKPQDDPPAARRSTQNYAHLLATHLSAKLTDLTVSGATLLNITSESQPAPLSSHVFPPQISQLPDDADIITITAGGNDVNYIGGIFKDVWDASLIGKVTNIVLLIIRKCSSILFPTSAPKASAILSPDLLAQQLGLTVDEIHRKVPKAHIFLVEYLSVFGPDSKPGKDVGFNQARIDHHRDVASVMEAAYVEVSSGRSGWCTRVPIHMLSQEHALGSPDPWVEGLSLKLLLKRGPIFHPNLSGMIAVAGILINLIEDSHLSEKVL